MFGSPFLGNFSCASIKTQCKLCMSSTNRSSWNMPQSYGSIFGGCNVNNNSADACTKCCKEDVHHECYKLCRMYLGKCILCKTNNDSPYRRYQLIIQNYSSFEDDFSSAYYKAELFNAINDRFVGMGFGKEVHIFLPKSADHISIMHTNIHKYKYYVDNINKELGCPDFCKQTNYVKTEKNTNDNNNNKDESYEKQSFSNEEDKEESYEKQNSSNEEDEDEKKFFDEIDKLDISNEVEKAKYDTLIKERQYKIYRDGLVDDLNKYSVFIENEIKELTPNNPDVVEIYGEYDKLSKDELLDKLKQVKLENMRYECIIQYANQIIDSEL